MADRLSEQTILEKVYQPKNKTLAVESYGFDGVLSQRPLADALAMKVVVAGTLTYLAIASPGTAQASALWQARLIDTTVSGTTVITWADGNAEFDNVATNLSALTYS